MKLSMSMIAWYLRDYHPECAIVDDKMTIQGIRFLSDEVAKPLPEYVYFSDAEQYFTDPQYTGAILLVHGQSTIFFRGHGYQELLNVLLSAFEFFNLWEVRLAEAATAQMPLQDMLELSHDVIGNPMVIADTEGGVFGSVGPNQAQQDSFWQYSHTNRTTHPAVIQSFLYDKSGNLIRDLSERPRLVQNVYPGGAPVIMMYLKQEEEPVAVVAVLQENETVTMMNLQLIPVMARYLINARELCTPVGAVRSGSAIVRDLLEGKNVGEENVQRLRKRLPPAPWRLLTFKHITRNDLLARKGLIRDLKQREFLYFPMLLDAYTIAIGSDKEVSKFENERNSLFDLQNFCIGVSAPIKSLNTLPLRLQQAKFAMQQAEHRAGIWKCERFAFRYLLGMLRSQEMTPSLLHPALEMLEQYDQENQGELLHTLSVYLRKGQNQVAAAQELHIHINTLKYRLNRIRELTNLNLSDEEELRYLLLSDWLCESR